MIHTYPFLISLMLLFYSCVTPEGKKTEITREYHLLESSMEFIPWSNVDYIVYKDSVGNEATFTISDPIQNWVMLIDPVCYEDSIKGDTTKYFLKQHYLEYVMTSDSLQTEFVVQLMPVPKRAYVKEGNVKDELRIGISTNPSDFFRGAPPKETFACLKDYYFGYVNTHELVFTHTVDMRNYPDPNPNGAKQDAPYDKITLHGKEYTEVFVQNAGINDYPFLAIKVQKVFGILSFVDKSDNQWVFDRVIPE
jgi:hypothetical protein